MTKLEKVTEGLSCCKNIDVVDMDISCYEPEFLKCPYHGSDGCVAKLTNDAFCVIQILQEQIRKICNAPNEKDGV